MSEFVTKEIIEAQMKIVENKYENLKDEMRRLQKNIREINILIGEDGKIFDNMWNSDHPTRKAYACEQVEELNNLTQNLDVHEFKLKALNDSTIRLKTMIDTFYNKPGEDVPMIEMKYTLKWETMEEDWHGKIVNVRYSNQEDIERAIIDANIWLASDNISDNGETAMVIVPKENDKDVEKIIRKFIEE